MSAAESNIDFARDIQPILEFNCVNCHTENPAIWAVAMGMTKKIAFTARAMAKPRRVIANHLESLRLGLSGDGPRPSAGTSSVQILCSPAPRGCAQKNPTRSSTVLTRP